MADPPDPTACLDVPRLDGTYTYLLGLYLGDGMLTLAPRRVYRLRIFLDQRYPEILRQCSESMRTICGHPSGRVQKVGCFEIYSNWKHWRCAFPQHGAGPKHKRSIILADWQRALVEAYPAAMVRGLIHSDGCRAINRVRRSWADRTEEYAYPRYFFSNNSAEIRAIFMDACRAIGVESRHNNRFSVSVARRDSVQVLEDIVGPKR